MNGPVIQIFWFGDFCLDAERRVLLRAGTPVPLTPKAFETLMALVRKREQVVGKDELLREIWPNTFVEEATLAQNIFTLRKALGEGRDKRQYIQTVPKHGYCFVAEVTEVWDDSAALVSANFARLHISAAESEATAQTVEEKQADTQPVVISHNGSETFAPVSETNNNGNTATLVAPRKTVGAKALRRTAARRALTMLLLLPFIVGAVFLLKTFKNNRAKTYPPDGRSIACFYQASPAAAVQLAIIPTVDQLYFRSDISFRLVARWQAARA